MITRIVLICICSLAVLGCGSGGDDKATAASGDDARSVVAAFYPLAFLAEQIGGTTADVRNLTPAGAEPHDVELSARDVETVRSADFVFYLGSDFQPAVEDAVEGADGEAVDLLSGLDLRTGAGEEAHEADPHVWLDPVLFTRLAERVGQALNRPEAARELETRLRGLDAEFERGLRSCERREIVTSHAAFGYLADRYDLEQISVTGISPEVEPSARDLEDVIAKVKEHGATTVFFETLVSPRLAQTVARETGARTAVLNPVEGLTPEQEERGTDYFDLMRDNLATLRQALGCR